MLEILLPEAPMKSDCPGGETGYRLSSLFMRLPRARIVHVWSEWGDVEPGRGDLSETG